MEQLDSMQPKEEREYVLTLQLNARLQPFDRGDIYEDPICEALEACGCGYTDGGGTLMQSSGEIDNCDIVIVLNENSEQNMEKLLHIINEIRVPKGSFLISDNYRQPLGTLEGLALYLNGTELSDEVYASCDINYVVERANELLAQIGSMYSHWEGAEYTALYFYGTSFDEMKEKIHPFLLEYPLCQKCKVEKIA